MVDQKLVDYIKDNLKQGFALKVIKGTAMEGGYTSQEFDEAVDVAIPKPASQQPKPAVVQVLPVQQTKSTIQQVQPVQQKPIVQQPQSQISSKSVIVNQTAKPNTSTNLPNPSASSKLNIFSKLGKSIASPNSLFEKTKSESLWSTIGYHFTSLVIPWIFGILLTYVIFSKILPLILLAQQTQQNSLLLAFEPLVTQIVSFGEILFMGIVTVFVFILLPVLTFAGAGALHIFVKLYGGTSKYQDTFKALVYSSTPSYLFCFLGSAVQIWSLVLLIFALSKYHGFTKLKSAFAIFTLPAIIIVASLVGIIVTKSLS